MTQNSNLGSIPACPPEARQYAELVKALGLEAVRPIPPKKARRVAPAANDGDRRIVESSRNNTLASIAGTMRRRGMTLGAIEAALQAENQSRCQPPLEASEVSAIACSIASYPAADPADALGTLTDTGNSARFRERYKDELRYVPERASWLYWEGQRWRFDGAGAVMERAKVVARAIRQEADALADAEAMTRVARHGLATQHAARLKAMVELARSEEALVAPISTLDSDDMLLGVLNGVVELSTGKLREAKRKDLISRQAPVHVDPKARCPVFEGFLATVFSRDKALISYIQRVVGYALTGLTDEQCLFFLYGHGANGKSTFLNVLLDLLGLDYALQTSSESLMAKRGGDGAAASSDVARLQGVRVTTANEIEEGARLAESAIKHLTGGDIVSCRFLYEEIFQFKPKLKLFIAGNHKPIIHGTDDGVWRRLHLIPFAVQIPKAQRDPKLMEKLRAELPGILNWAIKGCLDWQAGGLRPPKVITDAVKSYRDEMDVLGEWIRECCKVDPKARWPASEAYRAYRCWAEENGFKPMSSTAFGRKLRERFERRENREGRFYFGIAPKHGG
ncbi:phage/plasmid primase, P4 family [Quisquiliibacterium transsilvanicum]|uniref:Putative DNA primase/helicase n=1 Tax=Quisquiliibacterium transsilvanicum TaxID=1549638 RepID=A0A7W8HH20_9BURK|nr:phage/plasmid primase, P4 family [Quisquiliibacterium transsilvanicum]MBB5271311.1 putative DNA primase/helicase [Quisquiliibacterium transsilvanicum]